jgi:phosphohistidine swiveling domain-containing protein
MRTYIFIRTYRTDALNKIFTNLFPLFKEISRRYHLPFDLVKECLPNELVNLNFPKPELIRERAARHIMRGVSGKIYYIYGDRAKRINKKLIKKINVKISFSNKIKNNLDLRGVIACQGIVRGVVKVIKDNLQLNKIKKGDILVAVMTTPDFVPAMEKAAAFVTDEGGILCHAAIVSREMKKPCIIGTKVATQVLMDGNIVEVNANKGTVKIIKS